MCTTLLTNPTRDLACTVQGSERKLACQWPIRPQVPFCREQSFRALWCVGGGDPKCTAHCFTLQLCGCKTVPGGDLGATGELGGAWIFKKKKKKRPLEHSGKGYLRRVWPSHTRSELLGLGVGGEGGFLLKKFQRAP